MGVCTLGMPATVPAQLDSVWCRVTAPNEVKIRACVSGLIAISFPTQVYVRVQNVPLIP